MRTARGMVTIRFSFFAFFFLAYCLLLLITVVVEANDDTTISSGEGSTTSDARGEYPNPGCPCIDSRPILAAKSNCETKRGDTKYPGVFLSDGTCATLDYGSKDCSTYDARLREKCRFSSNPPGFCKQSWCYVDRHKCRQSKEQVYKSDFLGLFWSYSTCGSSAQDWFDHQTIDSLAGKTLVAAIPELMYPRHYKLDPSSGQPYNATTTNDDRFDDLVYNESIPWRGIFIDYFRAIVEVSNIGAVRTVYKSKGSQSKGIENQYTQAVSDVSAGIVDVSISGYWQTTERLALSDFTIPFWTDPFYLWIPHPETHSSSTLGDSTHNIFQPFSTGLWMATLGTILAFAIGTVLVSPDRHREFDDDSNNKDPITVLEKTRRACIILTDAFNTAFLEFLGRGVDHRTNANSSQKLLNIGFAFFIFITATAYTANTAAFLTRAHIYEHLTSIEHAIHHNTRICAPHAIEEELKLLHPTANFVFRDRSMNVVKAYEEGRCQAIVLGWFGVQSTPHRQEVVCANNLVRVGNPVWEDPIGFPVKKELRAGLSHWISQAESKGITLDSFIQSYQDKSPPTCDLDVILMPEEGSDLQQLTPQNMMLPLLLFAVASTVAMIIHLAKLLHSSVYQDKGGSKTSPRTAAEKHQPTVSWSALSVVSEEESIASSVSCPKPKLDASSRADRAICQLFTQQQDLLQNCQHQHALLRSLLPNQGKAVIHDC